jgi:DMSO reductase family type II enzyme heme b subunit
MRKLAILLINLVLNQKILLSLSLLGMSVLYAEEPDLGTELQREAGRKLYMRKCAQCHGEKGDGRGIASPFFNPPPRDFTSATFKIRTTESGELPTDEDLKETIKKGIPHTGMPAWPDFTDDQLFNLVYFIKTFAEDFTDPDAIVAPLTIPKAPPFSELSANKGRKVYEENQCIDCHGKYGRGDGESAPTLEDDWGRYIRPTDLTKRWTFRGGTAREDIYRTFNTGLNGTPMPSYADHIEPEDRWRLVDYVYSLSSDTPDYATVVVAKGIVGKIDIGQGKSLFHSAKRALFPIVGQVIEPGRDFYPGVNAIEVKALYNKDYIAIMLSWHDMSAETSGSNSPDIAVPRFDHDAETTTSDFSDAVALQIPSKIPRSFIKPYFLSGDRKNPVDLWFVNLAKGDEARLYVAKGSQDILYVQGKEKSIRSVYEDGEWTVIFKQKRDTENVIYFKQGSFIPVAFSIWDGFNKERGNKRGITSWYNLYLEPLEAKLPVVQMVKYAMLTLMIEIGIIYYIRKKYKGRFSSK